MNVVHLLEMLKCGVTLQAFENLHKTVVTSFVSGYAVGDEQEHVRVLLTPGSSGMCSSPNTRPDCVYILMNGQV